MIHRAKSSMTMPGVLLAVALALILAQVAGLSQTRTCTRPDAGRPAPLRLPPCELAFMFDFQKVSGAACGVVNTGLAEHQAFAADKPDRVEHRADLFDAVNLFCVCNHQLVAAEIDAAVEALCPFQIESRRIENYELDRVREMLPAVLRREPGRLELTATRPNLTVQLDALGQRIQKPIRRINTAPLPRPQRLAVPIGTAPVVFLGRDPARHIFTGPIAAVLQSRFWNEHGQKLPVQLLNCKAYFHG